MIRESWGADPREGDYVALAAAGEAASGEFRCSECGYGVAVSSVLPACPMCAGRSWEEVSWGPPARVDVAPEPS